MQKEGTGTLPPPKARVTLKLPRYFFFCADVLKGCVFVEGEKMMEKLVKTLVLNMFWCFLTIAQVNLHYASYSTPGEPLASVVKVGTPLIVFPP